MVGECVVKVGGQNMQASNPSGLMIFESIGSISLQ